MDLNPSNLDIFFHLTYLFSQYHHFLYLLITHFQILINQKKLYLKNFIRYFF